MLRDIDPMFQNYVFKLNICGFYQFFKVLIKFWMSRFSPVEAERERIVLFWLLLASDKPFYSYYFTNVFFFSLAYSINDCMVLRYGFLVCELYLDLS